MKIDSADRDKISSKSVVLSPFSPDSSLSLVSGVVTGEGVNVHENGSVICAPMHNMFGQPAFTISFGRSCK